ncbi:hypothetical protein FRC20_006092, partial [Serendipita sp. 405]
MMLLLNAALASLVLSSTVHGLPALFHRRAPPGLANLPDLPVDIPNLGGALGGAGGAGAGANPLAGLLGNIPGLGAVAGGGGQQAAAGDGPL